MSNGEIRPLQAFLRASASSEGEWSLGAMRVAMAMFSLVI